MKPLRPFPIVALLAAAGPLLGGATAPRLVPPPPGESIPVAFVLTDGAVMIDFAGPWEVFQDVHVPSRGASMEAQMPFRLFTVSDTRDPIRASDGLRIVPDYSFDDAPQPRVVVVPAQSGESPKMMDWLRRMARQSDVVMSVCTGAYQIATAGLLDGKPATTHHGALASFRKRFPKVRWEEGMRFVQGDPVVFTAGGLSSGIDLALHVVDLWFGRAVAESTARQMEYEGTDWTGSGAASASFASPSRSPASHPSDGLRTGVFGNWEGTLEAIEGPLRILLHIWPAEGGAPAGSVDDPAEEIWDEEMRGLKFRAPDLHFEVGNLSNSFDGKLAADGSAITGTWTLRHGTLPVVFHRAGAGAP